MRLIIEQTNVLTLCLDEFPYLVEQSPELPSVLQKLVDEKQLKYNLVLLWFVTKYDVWGCFLILLHLSMVVLMR